MVKGGMSEEMAEAVLELLRPHSGEGLMTGTVREVTGQEPISFEQWVRDNISSFQ
jgi:hypothetical protein